MREQLNTNNKSEQPDGQHSLNNNGVRKRELSPVEREFWLEEAQRNEIRRQDHQRYADEYRDKRDQALERLGMIRRIGKAVTEQAWLGNE